MQRPADGPPRNPAAGVPGAEQHTRDFENSAEERAGSLDVEKRASKWLLATGVAPDAFYGPAETAGRSRRALIHVAQRRIWL